MASWKDKESPLMSIINYYRANKRLIPLVLAVLGFTALSSHLNTKAADAFADIKSFAPQNSKEQQLIFGKFTHAVTVVFVHYIFNQISEFIGHCCALIVYRAFLCESVNKHLWMDYSEYHAKGTGRVQEDISRSSKAARGVICMMSFELPRAAIEFGFSFARLYTLINPPVFAVFFGLFAVTLVISVFIALYTYRNDRITAIAYKKTIGPLNDIINNFDLIKAYNKENEELNLYDRALHPFVSQTQVYYAKWSALFCLQKMIVYLPHFYIFYSESEGSQIWRDRPDEGNFASRLVILLKYNDAFNMMKKSMMGFRDKVFATTREMSEMDGDLKFKENLERAEPGQTDKTSFDGEIRLEDVDLYAGNRQIQRNQSFTIKRGEKVAITGMNGAGKSVFTKTLLKFFKNEGKFYIDDVLIEKISTTSMRNLLSYVPQDPYIFNNTVLYNLGYTQKELDPQKIYSYCEKFGLHDFFKQMRDGYLTQAGERGKYLSGGQKQRVAFMRAIIKDSPILVMDEPTANIDKHTEYELIDKVLTLCSDKTFLLIVHNPELLRRFDKVLYFTKDGIKVFDSYEQYANRVD